MNERAGNEVEVVVGEMDGPKLYAVLIHGGLSQRIESPVYGDQDGRVHAIRLLEMACEGSAMKAVYEAVTGLVVPNIHVFDGEKMVLAGNYAEMERDWEVFQSWSSANPIKWVVQQPEGFGFGLGEKPCVDDVGVLPYGHEVTKQGCCGC